MRAPLAFLLAAGIMVGGGYAGLVWLASPSTIGHGASSRSQNASSAPNANVPSEAVVDENGSAGRTQNEESTSLSPLRTGGGPTMGASSSAQQAAENDQSSATGSLTEQTGATKAPDVRAGGCMPIGITAGGNLVFPMACRELLEQHRGAHASLQARPEPTPAAPPKQSGTVNQDVQTAGSVRGRPVVTMAKSLVPSRTMTFKRLILSSLTRMLRTRLQRVTIYVPRSIAPQRSNWQETAREQ